MFRVDLRMKNAEEYEFKPHDTDTAYDTEEDAIAIGEMLMEENPEIAEFKVVAVKEFNVLVKLDDVVVSTYAEDEADALDIVREQWSDGKFAEAVGQAALYQDAVSIGEAEEA